jgi:hypothetical protein
MKLTIEPTKEFFLAGDVMVRLWRGTDADGQTVMALLSAVIICEPNAPPPAGLVSIPPPTPEGAARWAQAVLSGDRRLALP